VKLILIGGVLGFVLGVLLTVIYFSLATFFEANAKALDERALNEEAFNAIQKAAEQHASVAEDAIEEDTKRVAANDKVKTIIAPEGPDRAHTGALGPLA